MERTSVFDNIHAIYGDVLSINQTWISTLSVYIEEYTNYDSDYHEHYLSVLRVFLNTNKKIKPEEVVYYVTVIMLHDILEDTDVGLHQVMVDVKGIYSTCDIPVNGVVSSIRSALLDVTRRDGESYHEYIERIITNRNPLSLMAKYCDMTSNLNQCNATPNSRKSKSLTKRYSKFIGKLKSTLLEVGTIVE